MEKKVTDVVEPIDLIPKEEVADSRKEPVDNLQLYNRLRAVPAEAQKEIKAGKLKGFTDINPMWRIKMLTETFGTVGFGWYTEIAEKWLESIGGQVAVQMKVLLYVKVDGEWSKGIEGIGGSMLYGKGVGEGTISDEAYKMAYTDALGICCKALGMAADIYFAKDRTKYDQQEQQQSQQLQQQQSDVAAIEAQNQKDEEAFGQHISQARNREELTAVWRDIQRRFGKGSEPYERLRVLCAKRGEGFAKPKPQLPQQAPQTDIPEDSLLGSFNPNTL